MSCYFLYTMTPVVEVALLPTGYVLGHALSSVQESASSNHEMIIHSEKYLHRVSTISSSSFDIPGAPDLDKPSIGASTRPSTCLLRRGKRKRSRSHGGVNHDASRRHVRRHRLRTRANDRVNHAALVSGLSQNDNGSRKGLTSDPNASMSAGVSGKPLLYCELCRVKLNAALQAKQHFEGKTHAKKVKLAKMCSSNSNGFKTATIADTAATAEDAVTSSTSSTSSSSSSSSGGEFLATTATPPAITCPDVYCTVCGISFNSDKQSKQHYRGKLHAKKQRLANHLSRCAARKRLRAIMQDEGRQRLARVDAKENHTPETQYRELSETRIAT